MFFALISNMWKTQLSECIFNTKKFISKIRCHDYRTFPSMYITFGVSLMCFFIVENIMLQAKINEIQAELITKPCCSWWYTFDVRFWIIFWHGDDFQAELFGMTQISFIDIILWSNALFQKFLVNTFAKSKLAYFLFFSCFQAHWA